MWRGKEREGQMTIMLKAPYLYVYINIYSRGARVTHIWYECMCFSKLHH